MGQGVGVKGASSAGRLGVPNRKRGDVQGMEGSKSVQRLYFAVCCTAHAASGPQSNVCHHVTATATPSLRISTARN
jgi:hypothetical protein